MNIFFFNNSPHRRRIRIGPISPASFFILIFFLTLMAVAAPAGEAFYSVQVSAFHRLDRAQKEIRRFRELGYHTFYRQEVVKGKGLWYRVYLGRFNSREEAEEQVKALIDGRLVTYYFIRKISDPTSRAQINQQEEPTPIENPPNQRGPARPLSTAPSNPPLADKEKDGFPRPPLFIKDITTRIEEDGTERVFIYSSRFFKPHVFSLEGERLRLVIDIKETVSIGKGLSRIPVNGEFIKQIRTNFHPDSKTLRVVLDLYPSKDYKIDPFFYQKNNIYALVVGERNPQQSPGPEAPPQKSQADQIHPAPEEPEPPAPLLRREAGDVRVDDVKEMLVKHRFYASCWNHNSAFCNPGGDFINDFNYIPDGTLIDEATGLMWQRSGSSETMTWDEAIGYVLQINRQGLAGYHDWRLPTIEELASLMEPSWKNNDLFIDPLFDTRQKSCWSLDTMGPERAWKANFHLGILMAFPLGTRNSVRLVRSRP